MTYAEMVEQMKVEIAAITDEDEKLFQQALWNMKITDQWAKERAMNHAMTIDEQRKHFVGKQQMFHSEINGYSKRVIREDDFGFYIMWFGEKMEVVYNPIFSKMEIKYRR